MIPSNNLAGEYCADRSAQEAPEKAIEQSASDGIM
jgi:hypothetical protein